MTISTTTPSTHHTTPTARVSQVLVISVIVLALFSVMHSFASWLGDAQTIAHTLWAKESVVSVVRAERLDVPANLIAETLVETPPGNHLSSGTSVSELSLHEAICGSLFQQSGQLTTDTR